uniref:Uncharacterized protein n=1 Tax=viral metagenome TaxID=1070528 RepID=A0A6H2A3T7_9ZZZZ
MIKRMTVGNVRVTFTIAHITKVVGVNSKLDDDRHILMWDFDNTPLSEVKEALRRVQSRFLLSDIYILRSSEPSNYIAYCFTASDWRRVVEIIAQTEYIDWNFFKYGVYRGRFTLRVSAKNGNIPKLVTRLEGLSLPDCEPPDLHSWVRYETLKGG